MESVSLLGKPKHYVKVAESGNRRIQAFCAECGTQLYATEAESHKVFNLRLGCVNERDQLPPVVRIWGQSAMPWLQSFSALPIHIKGLASPLMSEPLPPDNTSAA